MSDPITINSMSEEFILWRCLHSGPISLLSIDNPPAPDQVDLEHCRSRNIPLLLKLTRTYGACAFLAQEGDRVVGQLRFYPRAVWNMDGAGGLCLQQKSPNGPRDDFFESGFPPLEKIEDKTLAVHCLMTGSPLQAENPYQRRGIASRMVRALIGWARERGWTAIEADAFEDLPLIYEVTGSAGITFWSRLGFQIADRHPHPLLQESDEFVVKLEEEARSLGISPERARDRIVLRLDL